MTAHRASNVALTAFAALIGLAAMGCARQPIVQTDLQLRRVVVYRNGIAYFERAGHVDSPEVRFKMRQNQVGDFLATLAVMEQGGSPVRAAAFPLKVDDENKDAKKKVLTEDERRGLRTVVLSLDGQAHDLAVGYVAESPVWRPSYRLVVQPNGSADLQAWGIVENLSGEDWRNVQLSLVAGAPLAFEADLGRPFIPPRPTVTDTGEVIMAMPRAETTLGDDTARAEAKGMPAPAEESDGDAPADEGGGGGGGRRRGIAAATGAARGPGAPPPPVVMRPMERAPAPVMPSPPRSLRSLAAVATEGGTTRYDIATAVTVPDKSATMVMLSALRVPGEASFLFAPDGGVPDSSRHPFRVARFTNATRGILERGPIAVFEAGSFLGQGLVDPLPPGATATVPFALERSLAVDQTREHDDSGERLAKIENSQLTIERDSVTRTRYRIKNGSDAPAKIRVKHPRDGSARLHQPPAGTEDNVGAGSALVPIAASARASVELLVEERASYRRMEDWFSEVADHAVKAYWALPGANQDVVAKLRAVWVVRDELVRRRVEFAKIEFERREVSAAQEETRRNLKTLEKNKDPEAEKLRKRLATRLNDLISRGDELSKLAIENGLKRGELEVRFREGIREIKIDVPSPSRL